MDKNRGLQNYLSQRGRADAFLFAERKSQNNSAHICGLASTSTSSPSRLPQPVHVLRSRVSPLRRTQIRSHPGNDQGLGHLESRFPAKTSPTASEKWVVDTISGSRIYHFHDTSPSASVMGLCNTVENQHLLGDAGNLAAFLLKMRSEHPEHYDRIVRTVRLAAPYLGDFDLNEVAPGRHNFSGKNDTRTWSSTHTNSPTAPSASFASPHCCCQPKPPLHCDRG